MRHRHLIIIYSEILFSVLLLASLASCIREYPEPRHSAFSVVLEADLMPPRAYKRVVLQKDGERVETEEGALPLADNTVSGDVSLRFVVEVYAVGRDRLADAEPGTYLPVERRELKADIAPDGLTATNVVTFDLPQGDYAVVAWADYTDRNTTADLYYTTAEGLTDLYFSSGREPENRTDRDAFAGSIGVRNDGTSQMVHLPLRRPLGHYTLVATDYEDFQQKSRGGADGMWLKVSYGGFPYTALDANTRQPGGRMQLPPFVSRQPFTAMENGRMAVAADYAVVMPDKETTVKVNVEVYAGDECVNRITNLAIPLMNNAETIVEGLLLTYDYKGKGGVGVDEGFDEEEIIYYP